MTCFQHANISAIEVSNDILSDAMVLLKLSGMCPHCALMSAVSYLVILTVGASKIKDEEIKAALDAIAASVPEIRKQYKKESDKQTASFETEQFLAKVMAEVNKRKKNGI